jgi:conjugal transfer mating pair stabilization protein TraN
MNRVRLVSVAVLLMAGMANANAQTDADAQYKAGADFAREIKGKGDSSLNNFNPGDSIPNYTDSPGEKNYYGGVKATSDGTLKTDGGNAWSQTEAGKAVTDSMMNNPKEPISPDAPFIQSGKDVQSQADTIIGKTGQMQCEAQQINRSEFTRHVCERDTAVLRTCERAAEIGGHNETRYENRSAHIDKSDIRWWREGNRIRGTFTAPFTGQLNSGSLYIEMRHDLHSYGVPIVFTLMGNVVNFGRDDWGNRGLNVSGYTLTQGQQVDIDITIDSGGNQGAFLDSLLNNLNGGNGNRLDFNLNVDGSSSVQVWVPTTSVPAECALAQEAGAVKVNTECSEPGGERQVVVNGQTYTVGASCWRFTDTYRLQEVDVGSCGTLANNPACTVAEHVCAFNDEQGACLRERVTYSCETRTTGTVMICGGETFCLDGECERAQQGKNNDFAPVVSALAALAAAGKDVADLNGVNVRAFTGSAKFCKMAAAGFSNCCKDSGWGQDVGIASCSTEEKALGKAKEKQLTVSVGEFCSKKVLGVCLEKKRGYCQFDSKLAQIVQQQGRNGQLHIGFGAAKSPDCRGITQTELQQIKFDNLDFSNFFDDLQNNQNIPDNNALTERVREQIATQLQSK